MLAASQDIDSFIERQRSQLNKQPTRQPVNRQAPSQPPPPPRPNVQDRLDFKVARILDEPPPRVQAQQPYYPRTSSPPFESNDQQENVFYDQQQQQQQRRLSGDQQNDNPAAFFNKFGAYDDKRSQLKDDLKREYNEYLQSQKRVPKSKSTSQLPSPRASTNKRVQFHQDNGKVVAPWEKNDKKTTNNVQSMNDLSTTLTDYAPTNRSRPQASHHQDDRNIRDREDYISELHSQIRELESRKKQLEIDSSRLSAAGPSNVARAHYTEDLNALNSLLAERLDQRNAVDHELAHILNRPPISASPPGIHSHSGASIPNSNMRNDQSHQGPSQRYPPPQTGRYGQQNYNENRSKPNDNGFQIGQETDKDAEQASKKRYQIELQAQMREAQMRKAQAKQDKDDYDRKLDAEIQKYNYFGRSGGGGAPMRDRDGNVVANLADVRNPPPPTSNQQQQQQQQHQHQQQQYYPPDDKVYSLGSGASSITNAPFYNGEQQPQQQYPSNSDRPGSPNHARGAGSNGMFGTAKTEEQFSREEKYKQDLKKQIDDKRQREVEETNRRRAEEDMELAKHSKWQQQMEKQAMEEAARKQEKEAQDHQRQQLVQDEVERQKKQDELVSKRKPKRQEKPMTPKRDDEDEGNDQGRQQNHSDHEQEQRPPPTTAYRSSSPPVPTLNNKGKKPKPKPKAKATTTNVRRQSYDDAAQQQSPSPPLLPFNNNDDDAQPPSPIDDTTGQGRQTYRKPPTPRQPDVPSTRKKPPQTYRSRPRADSNSGMPMRTNSTTSLRSDGSDSEILNRLDHLKRQLKDKEARLQEHVTTHQTGSTHDNPPTTTYQPPSQPPVQRKQSPGFLLNAARVHHRDSPSATNDKVRRILQTDDDLEYKPSYFRDDTTLMSGAGKSNGHTDDDDDYYTKSKRVDSANRMFVTKTEKEASRRRYGFEPASYRDHEDPTNMANYELNRIAEKNEQRLKKLRDLENDDASLLDSNEVLERFQQKQRLRRGGSQTTLEDDTWLK